MMVNENYTFSFKIPEEYNKAMMFKQKHPEYEEIDSSGWVNFKMTRMYSVDISDWSDEE